MNHRVVRLIVGLAVAVVMLRVPLVALEMATHVLLNQEAVASWTFVEGNVVRNRLDGVLRDALGYDNGRQTELAGRLVEDWIDLGGRLEDEGSAITGSGRFYRHFHDPLKGWDSAGLKLPLLPPNESSVRWMQNRDQGSTGAAGGNWSWHDARRMYYQSLTERDPATREALLAATFRALGQVMHLVVDASNPDHVRNDAHPLPSAPWVSGLFWNYDKWVQVAHGASGSTLEEAFVARFLANPIGFDPAILSLPTGDPLASVPIARLIDSDVYDGTNPSVTFNAASPSAPAAVGIAETANANFFSEDTLTGQYPFPRPGTEGLIATELTLSRKTPDGRDIVRRYWTRPPGQGLLPANPLRAECASDLTVRLGLSRPFSCVDGVVWDQVAAHMLPRAVGYARGVLDYFFRGRFTLQYIYVRILETSPRWPFPEAYLVVARNDSGEPMEGTFEVYSGSPAESRQRPFVLHETSSLAPGAMFVGFVQVPPPDASRHHVLVFRGTIGLEENAVASQAFVLP